MPEREPHFEEEPQMQQTQNFLDSKEPTFEKENSPSNQEQRGEKEFKWKEAEQNLEKFGGIEKGIRDTVVALNVFGIKTVNSCEGHYNHGRIAPWVSIEKWESKPQERYTGSKEFEQEFYEELGVTELNKNYAGYLKEFDARRAKILGPEKVEPDSEEIGRQIAEMHGEVEKEYGVTPEITKKWMEAGTQVDKEIEKARKDGRLQETEEYKNWKTENDAMKDKAQQLLDEFYENRKVPKDARLIIDQDGTGSWCIYNGGKDYYDVTRQQNEIPDTDKKYYQKILDGKNSKKEQNELEGRVENYRTEFQDFSKFLKQKYFTK